MPKYARPLMWVGIIGLPVFTIADMIYSGIRVSKHYKKLSALGNDSAGSVSWNIAPRLYETERIFTRNGETMTARWSAIDGADVAATCAF